MQTKDIPKKKRNWRSLKVLTFLILATLAIVPTLIVGQIMQKQVVNDQISSRMRQVQGQLLVLATDLGKSAYMQGQNDAIADAEMTQVSNLYDGRILVINRDYLVKKDTYALDEGKVNISEEVIMAFRGTTSTHYDEGNNYFEICMPVYDESGNEVIGALLAEVSTQTLATLSTRLAQRLRSIETIVIAIAVPAAVLLALLLTYPLTRIHTEMDKSAAGNLDSTLKVYDFRETEAISNSYNNMVARLQRIDESRQQFVSNVSHELKTPITSMKVLADSLLEQENVPVELYREFMSDIREEIEREGTIIEDLLTLVRMDKPDQELTIKAVNLNLFLENLLHRLKPLAQTKNLDVVLESFRPVTGEVDEVKFSLAISNIIENAIKYNVPNGWIRVTLNADYKYFYIKIADSGIGIPQEAQDHVFERFYRADKSRSRESGGTGLGLAITQDIVFMHHGAIKLHSEEGEGTTFIVRVPLIYIP